MSGILFHFCFSSHTIHEEQILLTWDLLHCLGFFNDMQKPVSPLQFFFSNNILQGHGREGFFLYSGRSYSVWFPSSRHTA